MIPERWEKVYLYASVVEQKNNLQTGEMFFYYIPKGVIKRSPVNVYEVPAKFSIDENKYFLLADELYGLIKEIRKEYYKLGEKLWSNVTISIENFKFKVEYNYENLLTTKYSSYDRHLVWRYKYLSMSLDSLSKKDRNIIKEYLNDWKTHIKENEIYVEALYNLPMHNEVNFNKEEKTVTEMQKPIRKSNEKNKNYKIKTNTDEKKEELENKRKNQIINF